MTNEYFQIIVNMPDCSNILFVFRNDVILKKINKSFNNSKNAVVFYNLMLEIQCKINKFLNPDAIVY